MILPARAPVQLASSRELEDARPASGHSSEGRRVDPSTAGLDLIRAVLLTGRRDRTAGVASSRSRTAFS